MFNLVQVLAGLALIFLLPGYTLVNVIFPRRGELDPEYDVVYRLALGMGLSVVVSIFVGFMLNAISDEESQYVRSGPLWLALSSLTGLFVLAGWFRGAYPGAGYIHPTLYRPTAESRSGVSGKKEFARKRALERLLKEREQLVVDLKKFAERSSDSNPQRQLYYRKRMDNTRERIDKVNEEIKKLQSDGV
ncbi:MAG: hypothetical protein A3K76_03690 [Euryarchaeota archaeon RBG_13_57_23]|nr:MAG: hypothetical protein A3K76_03690 [Euryarchaeota archaeon RBG_13_57_23]